MSTSNKLNLKEFVKMEQQAKQNQFQKFNNSKYPSSENKDIKNIRIEKRQSNKQTKKLKLNTLPCQEIQQEDSHKEKFLFRSTWEEDNNHMKQQMNIPGACTSPTFATQILSHTHNNSHLFPPNDQISQQNSNLDFSRRSNSRSKSKNHNKASSIKKFIGDYTSSSNQTNKFKGINLSNAPTQRILPSTQNQLSSQQKQLYLLNKSQFQNHELKRQNKKLQQKYEEIKIKFEFLQKQKDQKSLKNSSNLMNNQQLFQRMKTQSFWKFYLKAQKMIKSSMKAQDQQSSSSILNFMKQLQALRQLTSQMKKQTKQLKKSLQTSQQSQKQTKQKISIYQTELQQMHIKIAAYEVTIKKNKQELKQCQKQLERLRPFKQLQKKYNQIKSQNQKLSSSFEKIKQQLQQTKILNQQCQKQRVSIKKKFQLEQEQCSSLKKQLLTLKNNYNLLQLQRQQMSANKKQLIEKQRLKQKNHQLEKELKNLTIIKEQQIAKVKQECDLKLSREIQEMKQSQVKEFDQKVKKVIEHLQQINQQTKAYKQQNIRLNLQVSSRKLQAQTYQSKLSQLNQQLQSLQQEKQQSINSLSSQLKTLTNRLHEQKTSVQSQSSLINQLKKQIEQKQELIKKKDEIIQIKNYESQKLKQSLVMIKQEEESKMKSQMEKDSRNNRNNKDQSNVNSKNQRQNQTSVNYQDYINLQQKFNEALSLYQTTYNQKIQLQLQLQYYQQQLAQLSQNNKSNSLNSPNNLQSSKQYQSQIIIEWIQKLLIIKQQIIKKILIFCPAQYKNILIDYIYYGDLIKQKYINLLRYEEENSSRQMNNNENYQNQTQQNSQTSRNYDQESQQLSESEYQYSAQRCLSSNNRTISYHKSNKNRQNNMRNQYNKTKAYDKNMASQQQNENQQQEVQQQAQFYQQINQLMQIFMKIGKQLQLETRKITTSKQKRQNHNLNSSKQKQEYELRRSKQKQNSNFTYTKSKGKPISIKNNPNKMNIKMIQSSNNQPNYGNSKVMRTCDQNYKIKNKFESKSNSFNTPYNNYNDSKYYEQNPINTQYYRQPLKSIQQSIQYRNNRSSVISNNQQTSHPLQVKKPISNYQFNNQRQNFVKNNAGLFNKRNNKIQQDYYEGENKTIRERQRKNGAYYGEENTDINFSRQNQKKIQVKKNNFNHGIINNHNLLKMIDKIKQ